LGSAGAADGDAGGERRAVFGGGPGDAGLIVGNSVGTGADAEVPAAGFPGAAAGSGLVDAGAGGAGAVAVVVVAGGGAVGSGRPRRNPATPAATARKRSAPAIPKRKARERPSPIAR